jgi:hypothetical protein
MSLETMTDRSLEASISARYLASERTRSSCNPELHIRFKRLLDAALAEYEKRHPLPPNCWYGMKARKGYPAEDGDMWVPWACGRITDLPLPKWVTIITAWTDLLGWRVIDLHEDHGVEYLKRALQCWLRGGHDFVAFVQDGGCFNNPFGTGPYSYCANCPACVRRIFDANGCEIREVPSLAP